VQKSIILGLFLKLYNLTAMFKIRNRNHSQDSKFVKILYIILKQLYKCFLITVQFGIPTVSSVGYVGFLIVTLVSVLESVCDYHAAARMSGVPPPPPHAVNRGIAMEGFASIISGMVGAGHATTSYSHNIGAIGITKVDILTYHLYF
jgi:nucleobase transporter 1/2